MCACVEMELVIKNNYMRKNEATRNTWVIKGDKSLIYYFLVSRIFKERLLDVNVKLCRKGRVLNMM